MGITVMTVSAMIAFATLALLTRERETAGAFPTHHSSPLDEADRILARRYAAGEITAQSYERMLVILHT